MASNYLWRVGNGLFGTAVDWQNTATGTNPATSAPGINDTASWSNLVGTVTGTGSVAQLTVGSGTPGGLVLAGQFTTVSALFAGSAALGSGGTLTVTGKQLSVTGTTSAPAILTVNSGASILLTAAADTSAPYLAIGSGAGEAGTVTVTGPNASIDLGANAAQIGYAGNGSLNISGGATVRSATADSSIRVALSLGTLASGSGTLTITGAGSSYTATGSAFFGRAGNGTLVIDQGGSFTGGSAATATVSSDNVTIGNGQSASATALFGGSGAVTLANGSVLHTLGNLIVGQNGDTGTMVVDTGSTVTVDSRIGVGGGTDRAGGNGSVTIKGGSTVRAGASQTNGTANIAIGSGAGNNGTVNVTGAGSILDGNGGRISIGTTPITGTTVTGTGTGSLTVSNGGTVLAGSSYSDTESALNVGAAQNETATVSISGTGSKLVATGQAVIGGSNSGSGVKAGGTGTVSIATGGLFRATSLALFAGSTLTVDATSIGVIGTTAGTSGLLTVDAAAAVSGAGAIHAKLLNNGSVIAQGGTLAIDQVDAASTGTIGASGGELDVASFGGTSLSFSGISSIVRLGAETAQSVAVTGFGGFDVLDFQNQTGLSLSGTAVTLAGGKTFAITGLASSSKLALSSDGSGGTALAVISATTVVKVANQYALNGSGGTGPTLKYNGSAVTAGQFGAGVVPVSALQISTGYQVVFSLGGNQFIVWNTDTTGNFTGSATGVLSGSSLALQSLETTFGADLNNDATIGLKLITIASNGITTLVQTANQYALNGSGGTGPTLQYNGSAVTVGQFGTGVTPIGAVQTQTGYEVAFSLGGNQFIVWNTDANGNYTSLATGVLSGSSFALQSFETTFGEDLNKDATVGLKLIQIATNGTTTLVQAANQYTFNNSFGTGPALQYNGSAVTVGQFGTGVTPIGAVKTQTGYQVAFGLGGNQFIVWNTDANGNYTSLATGVLSGSSFALQSFETGFGEDLNNDAMIGPKLIIIATNGTTTLAETADQYALNGSGGTGPTLQVNGSAVTVGQFGAKIAPVGAVKTQTGYQVAFGLGGNQFIVWNTDVLGNYTSLATGVLSGSSLALQSFETIFGEDINNDATIGPKLTTIISNGTTTLVQVANQYTLNGSGGTGPTLQYNGSAVTTDQFGAGVAPIGALKTQTGYQVAFALGGNQFTVWNTDANGNFTGLDTGVLSGSSSRFAAVEASFVEDLNGDGMIDFSSVTTPQTINLGGNTASVMVGLDQPSLTFIGLPKTISLGSGGSTVDYALQSTSGILEVSNYSLGRDMLNIDMMYNSGLVFHDTKVGGVNAISLSGSTDALHGIVLLNVGTLTAANLLGSHTNFTGGHAIIT